MDFTREQFKHLTLQDFHLYSLRAIERSRKRREDHELFIELQRSWMALYANSIKGKNTTQFKPADFFTLSYDSELKNEKPVDQENFLKEMAFRFTPRNKRKKDG